MAITKERLQELINEGATIWSDVWNEVVDEQADAEEEIKQSNTDEQDEKEWREYNEMIDREYHRDRI